MELAFYYEITLYVYPYYRAHMGYGEDEVVINTRGELISFMHLKTYP
ncbi:DUF3888 domain-containing protein [Bacillus cihuensis]|nr:DUF3888 domain-containing protein [Bacillus cihuensis]